MKKTNDDDDDSDDDDNNNNNIDRCGGVRISEVPFDAHFLNAVSRSLATSVTETVFQSLYLPHHL
jgi:hypothetical protein